MINFVKSLLDKTFFKYLFVGGTSFVLDYLIYFVLYNFVGIGTWYANAISVFTAFWYNFLLNRIWSFKSNEPFFKQISYYLVLMFFNMLFSSWFIDIMYIRFDINPNFSKVIAMCIIVAWNFIIYKTIIFKSKK